MIRARNTQRDGSQFDEYAIEAVWKKGKIEPSFLSFKKDVCNASIQRIKYGKTEKYGWEIDHIKPASLGDTDDIINLQPLQWENNRHKSDDTNWSCLITD